MRRSDTDLLADILAAVEAIRRHQQYGDLSIEIVLDSIAMRLLEIGEAVKALSPSLTATEPTTRWRDIAGMRDFLAHHYFSTEPAIIQNVLDKDLDPLASAAQRLLDSLGSP